MIKSPVAATLVIGGLLAMTACGSSSALSSASPSTSLSTSASASPSAVGSSPTVGTTPPAAAACDGATPMAGPVIRVEAADQGKKLCVSTGTEVVVLLKGSVTAKWVGIHSSSTAILTPVADQELMLQVGWSGAAFRASSPGTAYISASRYPCGSSSPGSRRSVCGVIIAYRVDVVVAASK